MFLTFSFNKGIWYNLGAPDENTMVIYYTAANLIENWFGGYVLRREGAPNKLNSTDLPKIITVLNRAFAIPANTTALPNSKVGDLKQCLNPLHDKCASSNRKCCIGYNDDDIFNMRYTCRKVCAAKPHRANPPKILLLRNQSISLLTGAAVGTDSFLPDTTDHVITIDDFQLLNL